MIIFAISSEHNYHFPSTTGNQEKAREVCKEKGFHLVRIESIEEYNAISAIINADPGKNYLIHDLA